MVHYLFVGHFEREGLGIRFSNSRAERTSKPVVRQPLDSSAVQELLKEFSGTSAKCLKIPDEWQVSLEDGYMICDRYTRSQEAIEFIAKIAKRTGAEIFDYSTLSIIPPDHLTYAWASV